MFKIKNIKKEFENLEEPISETIKKDLLSILLKLRFTLLPFSFGDKMKQLKDWDLFGPLLISLSYSWIMLTKTNDSNQFFSSFFIILIFGTLMVTFNLRLLGGEGSVFLFLSILGYCMTPFLLSALIKITLGNFNGIFVL